MSFGIKQAVILVFVYWSYFVFFCHGDEDHEMQPDWSVCDPCTLTKSRIVLPWLIGKDFVPENIVEFENCITQEPCPQQYLSSCNGSKKNVTPIWETDCQQLKDVPYVDHISSGLDLHNIQQVKGRIFNNHHFTSVDHCRKVIDNNARKVYKMPSNLDNVQFEVDASGQIEVSSFLSNYEYTKAMEKSSGSSTSFSAGFHIAGFGLSEGISFSQSSTFKTLFHQLKYHKAVLFQVKTQVSLVQFVYKSAGFALSQYFVADVKHLPMELNDKAYFDFFKQYGTHYIHSGTLGGNYQYFYTFAEDVMKQMKQNSQTLTKCLKVSAGVSLFGFKIGGSSSKCKTTAGQEINATEVVTAATKKIVDVAGGTATVAGRLAGASVQSSNKQNVNMTLFEEWILGVQQNPTMLQRNVKSICNLLLGITDIDSSEKVTKYGLCVNATVKYYEPFNGNKCPACKNGGSKLTVGGTCQCACQSSFWGDLCENQWGGESNERKTVPVQNPIKLILASHVAEDPPLLALRRNSWEFGGILKYHQHNIYHLISDMDKVTSDGNGSHSGNYTIQVFNEFLDLKKSINVKFTYIKECTPSGRRVACRINDFSLTCEGKIIISVGIFEISSHYSFSGIYVLDDDGKATFNIQKPCTEWDSDWNLGSFIAGCSYGDSIVVSCPVAPAVIKVFSVDGSALFLTQLPSITPITGMISTSKLCVHTKSNEVALYDQTTWEMTWYAKNSPTPPASNQASNTQISQDFLSNFVIGQSYKEKAETQPIAQVIDPNSKTVIMNVIHKSWTHCYHVVTYGTKMFLSCKSVSPSPKPRGLLVIDYLR